ncbi:hypothetical protein, partial [Enterobacter hormaechei]|uniref:hypothetical protein n=1 Tax=Enterobacter hormaechei TaxID=158836 RepID=UPI001A93CC35
QKMSHSVLSNQQRHSVSKKVPNAEKPSSRPGGLMNFSELLRYQAESVKRANMPPVAKHGQTKTNQPQKEAA